MNSLPKSEGYEPSLLLCTLGHSAPGFLCWPSTLSGVLPQFWYFFQLLTLWNKTPSPCYFLNQIWFHHFLLSCPSSNPSYVSSLTPSRNRGPFVQALFRQSYPVIMCDFLSLLGDIVLLPPAFQSSLCLRQSSHSLPHDIPWVLGLRVVLSMCQQRLGTIWTICSLYVDLVDCVTKRNFLAEGGLWHTPVGRRIDRESR